MTFIVLINIYQSRK